MAINKDIACLFDLDGVLVDSERIYTKIWEAYEAEVSQIYNSFYSY